MAVVRVMQIALFLIAHDAHAPASAQERGRVDAAASDLAARCCDEVRTGRPLTVARPDVGVEGAGYAVWNRAYSLLQSTVTP